MFLNICMPNVVQLLCFHYSNRNNQMQSFAVDSIRDFFLQEYQLSDVFSNPLDTVNFRNYFVENSERFPGVILTLAFNYQLLFLE